MHSFYGVKSIAFEAQVHKIIINNKCFLSERSEGEILKKKMDFLVQKLHFSKFLVRIRQLVKLKKKIKEVVDI